MDAKEIVAAARSETGLTDYGDEAIIEGLTTLTEALDSEAKLTERGKAIVERTLIDTLAGRLRVEDYLAKHPELLDQPVDKPMFVFGLPRTGTTLVINLLQADPARRCFVRWESINPVPPPKAGEFRTDPRYVAEQARLDMSVKYAPHISAMHHEDADSPSECQFSMAPSFITQVFDSQWRVPSYRRWLFAASYLPAFRYQKRLFQVLQSEAPGRWTLKNPWHPLFLDDLTTVYPDAQLVMTHRDPAEVVASACSLVRAVRDMFSDDVDPREVAAAQIETFDLMIARQDAYRAKHGAGSIHDVDYKAMVRDPIGEMRKLYAHFDEPLTPAAEAAMQAVLAANPKGKHGKHEYSLADFGLTREGVREHFRGYIERFGL
ncbi:MAG: sulfotransferase domain protein [Novosphingobium sp.]|nr:sulfotransferase domain protein [Novosphingobium sp.]